MGWQAIASVPKDGTLIWLYGIDNAGEDRGVLAFWPLDHDADGWYEHEASSYPVAFEPTHWAPFVAP